MHSDQFKPKSYLKLNKKYVFSEGEQFPLSNSLCKSHAVFKNALTVEGKLEKKRTIVSHTSMLSSKIKPLVYLVKKHGAYQYRDKSEL